MTRGIFMDIDDTLYVADYMNARVVLIKPNSTTAVSVIQYTQNGSSLFTNTPDLFVTEKYLYVLDSWKSHVLRFFKNGTNPTVTAGITDQWEQGLNTSIIYNAYNIFVDSQEQLYVCDAYRSIVIRYPSNSTSGSPGLIVAGNGTYGDGPMQLNWPQGMFVDVVGTLYVADGYNHRIQMWLRGASSGTTVAGTGLAGDSLSQLNYPAAVIVDTNGYMYIADGDNQRILRWAPNSFSGECIIACTGVYGLAANTLAGPVALTFDALGNLFVSDQYNCRIQKFTNLDTSSKIC